MKPILLIFVNLVYVPLVFLWDFTEENKMILIAIGIGALAGVVNYIDVDEKKTFKKFLREFSVTMLAVLLVSLIGYQAIAIDYNRPYVFLGIIGITGWKGRWTLDLMTRTFETILDNISSRFAATKAKIEKTISPDKGKDDET